jgi:hypothetical protein
MQHDQTVGLQTLARASGVSDQQVIHLLHFICDHIQQTKANLLRPRSDGHDSLRKTMARLQTFVPVNGRLFLYGCLDDEDPQQTQQNLKTCYESDLGELNHDLHTQFSTWESVHGVGDIVEASTDIRHTLLQRCRCQAVVRSEKMGRWMRSTYKTLLELNRKWNTDYVTWSAVVSMDPDTLTAAQSEELQQRCEQDRHVLAAVLEMSALSALEEESNSDECMLPTGEHMRTLARLVGRTGVDGRIESTFVGLAAFASRGTSDIPVSTWYAWMLAYIAMSVDAGTFVPLPNTYRKPDSATLAALGDWLLEYHADWDDESAGALEKLGKAWGRVYNDTAQATDTLPPTVLPSFAEFAEAAAYTDNGGDHEATGSEHVFQTLWADELPEFRLMVTAPNGDCFFEALSTALGEGISVSDMRRQLAEIVPTLVDGSGGKEGWRSYRDRLSAEDRSTRTMNLRTLQSYIQSRRHWATEEDLRIFTRIYDVHFVLLNWDGGFDCVGHTDTVADAYVLLFYNPDVHYDLVARGEQTIFTRADLPPVFFQRWESVCGDMDLRAPIHPLFTTISGGATEEADLSGDDTDEEQDQEDTGSLIDDEEEVADHVPLPNGWVRRDRNSRSGKTVTYLGPQGERAGTVKGAWQRMHAAGEGKTPYPQQA